MVTLEMERGPSPVLLRVMACVELLQSRLGKILTAFASAAYTQKPSKFPLFKLSRSCTKRFDKAFRPPTKRSTPQEETILHASHKKMLAAAVALRAIKWKPFARDSFSRSWSRARPAVVFPDFISTVPSASSTSY